MTKRRLVRGGLAVLFLCIFSFAAYDFWQGQQEYATGKNIYNGAVNEYVKQPAPAETEPAAEDIAEPAVGPAPIEINFEALLQESPDVQGWIYCEGTNINYPIVQGRDNNQYLRHTYTGEYAVSGSIFIEAKNAPGFADSNTVIYGHHMKDGSMFHSLSEWADQEFYEAHPNMWLLTPDGDYRVDLIAGYITPADSDTYAIFQGPSEYFDEYLGALPEKSDFKAPESVTLDRDAKYVILSTCDYTYKDARYVLHGKLVPCNNNHNNQKEDVQHDPVQ